MKGVTTAAEAEDGVPRGWRAGSDWGGRGSREYQRAEAKGSNVAALGHWPLRREAGSRRVAPPCREAGRYAGKSAAVARPLCREVGRRRRRPSGRAAAPGRWPPRREASVSRPQNESNDLGKFSWAVTEKTRARLLGFVSTLL